MFPTLLKESHLRSLWNCKLLRFLRAQRRMTVCARLMAADYYEGDASSNTTNTHNRSADESFSMILMLRKV